MVSYPIRMGGGGVVMVGGGGGGSSEVGVDDNDVDLSPGVLVIGVVAGTVWWLFETGGESDIAEARDCARWIMSGDFS